ncbi:MAG TPA: serine/threonine-protein kinase [Gemmataceae bacterium]|nr:serine/threonine-protein kinase [Gemmataceae bacterium]
MSNPYAISRKLPNPNGTVTDVHVNGSMPAAPSHKLHCKLAAPGSGQMQTSEVAPLLRYRLRLATIITLVTFAIFLVRNFLNFNNPDGPTPVGLAIHSFIVAVMIVLASLLWTSIPFSVRALRAMELTLFGMAALFFVYLHFTMFSESQVLKWANADHQDKVVALATTVGNMRWFMLIVLYGTFVPNTWRRCALIVGILAAIPITLNIYRCTVCPHFAHITGPFPIADTLIVLGLASAIAIFGSYKISVLQQQAVVARELGQYRLKEKLGSGGMGEVYLGEHVLLRRQCAVKLIRPDQAGDPTNLQRFEREVQAMATLTHWNTVEVFDYGHAEDGTFYYAMEYLPGLTLQELVDKYGPLPPERAIHFLRQICGALQEAHGLGIIHRDVKPSNVIVCERGGVQDVAKLLDFGLVQCLGIDNEAGKLTVQGVILGSPPYMAPEQALGRSNLDARTDIYSVGGLAYFLLTGQPPFVRDQAMEMLVAHAHEKPAPMTDLRPSVPDDLQAVVMKCLEKDPGRRFASADDLEQALAQCDAADQWNRHTAALWWKESIVPARVAGEGVLVG